MNKVGIDSYSLHAGRRNQRVLSFSWYRAAMITMILIGVGLFIGVRQLSAQAQALSASSTKHSATATAAKIDPKTAMQPVEKDVAIPLPETSDAVKQAIITALSQNSATTWSVALYSLDSDQAPIQINADAQLTSASLYKLYTAYALAQKLPFAQWDSVTVADHTLKQCVDLMLRVSDNACGEAVSEYLGWGAIDKVIHAYGFKNTDLNDPSGPVTTANDTANFMSDLYAGKLFDSQTTSFVTSALSKQLFRAGIPAGCKGCQVMNKTGSDDQVTHDAAIVHDGSRSYVVVIMSVGGSYQKIASVEQAIVAAMHAQ